MVKQMMAANEANVLTTDKPTSRKSCSVTIQLNTKYMRSSSRIKAHSYGATHPTWGHLRTRYLDHGNSNLFVLTPPKRRIPLLSNMDLG